MSDMGKKETLSLTGEARPLSLRKPADSGQVKQNFSHGRSKTVQVEVRKRRTAARAAAAAATAPEPPPPLVAEAAPAPEVLSVAPALVEAELDTRVRHVLPTLSEAQKATRARALEGARIADQQARHDAEEQLRLREIEDSRLQAEREAAEIRRSAEDERKRLDSQARLRSEEDANDTDASYS